jgi:hypothetical protein
VKRVETKIWLTPDERTYLDQQAQALTITRGELIRHRAIGTAPAAVISLAAYQRAIESAARTVSGIPRQQLEAIVAAAITAIGKPRDDKAA